MSEERGAAQAYVMIYKGGKMWPAVRCRPPMEVPSEHELQKPTSYHTCVFIPVIYEFHWKMETELSAFDNDELSKFTKADEPERFEAFWTIIERLGDGTPPDYGWWASEILAHQLHKEFYKNEPVNYESSDSEPEIISAAEVVKGPKPRASGSMATDGKGTQSRATGTARVGKSDWLSLMNCEATKKLEEKKKNKKRSLYIPDEIDDEPPRPRKKLPKSSTSGNVLSGDFSTPWRAATGDKPLCLDEDDQDIDDLELLIMRKKEEEEEDDDDDDEEATTQTQD